MENNKNFIIAIALSLAVLLGWQYLYMQPMAERARQQQAIEAMRHPQPKAGLSEGNAPGAPATAPALSQTAAPAAAYASREAAIAATPRVKIESPALTGSINLKGGRIDDVVLRDYTETVKPDSPKVVLLSPSGSPHPYFALTGWLPQPGVTVPDANTLWEQEGTGPLTATHPVVLRYDNGQDLVFRRTISVDDRYMFKIADSVENKSGQPVTLTPWGQVARLTEPKTLGYSVLHEGLIAGLGKDGTKDFTYSAALKNYE
ncbi:MAG: membrane protein insertase YidC, partial [Rhodomicrobium sp.]